MLPHPEQRAAGVPIVVLHGVRDLPDAEVVLIERAGIHLDLVLANEAAEGGDIGHPRDLEQPRRHDPVLDLAQLHRVVAGTCEDVAIELADPADQGAERRRDALGKISVAQLLEHDLPGEVIVGGVGERELDN